MLAFVDTDPADQLTRGLQALSVMEGSSQPATRQWEGSLRNNVGYALHQQGRYEEALAQFTLALAFREHAGNAEQIRVANWMVAWTLRALGRMDEALDIQLRLERECEVAGAPDPYVFEELESLYRARNDTARADAYAELQNEHKRNDFEVAILDIRTGKTAEFEAAFQQASPLIASMPGYIAHELQKCVETSHRYILLVNWQTLEAHTVGFRQSPEYQEWKRLLHRFYDPFPNVEHYQRIV